MCVCVLRLHSGFLQVFCVFVAGYTEGFYRCFVCVLQFTLRVSTGVLYVCVAGYTQGFYRCSVCQGCTARTTGSQSDPLVSQTELSDCIARTTETKVTPLVSRTELPDCIAWTTETKVTPWCHGLSCQTAFCCCPTASHTGDKQPECSHQRCQPAWGVVGGWQEGDASFKQLPFEIKWENCAALHYLSVFSLC